MLPPMLRRVRTNLEKKPKEVRTEAEGRLLEELRFLDDDLTVESTIEDGLSTGRIARIVGGPGNCPCCGK